MQTQQLRGQAWKIIIWQALVTLIIAGGFLLLTKKQAAIAAIAGGMVCVIPNLFFVWKFFALTGATKAKAIVKNFFLAEVIKLVLTLALFAVALVKLQLEPLPLFIGFIAAQLVFWFAPLITK